MAQLTNQRKDDSRRKTSSSSRRTTLQSTEIIEPSKYDILCGKDKGCITHYGSQHFRVVIESYRKRYQKLTTKQERMDITKEIIDHLMQTTSSKFLKFNAEENGWQEISHTAARDKVSHALRFAIQREERKNKNGKKTVALKKQDQQQQESSVSNSDKKKDDVQIDENLESQTNDINEKDSQKFEKLSSSTNDNKSKDEEIDQDTQITTVAITTTKRGHVRKVSNEEIPSMSKLRILSNEEIPSMSKLKNSSIENIWNEKMSFEPPLTKISKGPLKEKKILVRGEDKENVVPFDDSEYINSITDEERSNDGYSSSLHNRTKHKEVSSGHFGDYDLIMREPLLEWDVETDTIFVFNR